MSTRVDVIIPVYDDMVELVGAIETVLAQKQVHPHVIVIDDGSTEDVPDLSGYRDRVEYHWMSHEGRSAARNAGIAYATSEYVAFLDVDDRWHPQHLHRHLRTHQETGCGLSYSWMYGVHQGRPHDLYRIQGLRVLVADHQDSVLHVLQLLNPFMDLYLGRGLHSPSSWVVQRSVLEDVQFDETLHGTEDWDFAIAASMQTGITCLMEPTVYYQLHGDSTISRWINWKVPEQLQAIVGKYAADATLPDYHRAKTFAQVYAGLLHLAAGNPLTGRQLIDEAYEGFPSFFWSPERGELASAHPAYTHYYRGFAGMVVAIAVQSVGLDGTVMWEAERMLDMLAPEVGVVKELVRKEWERCNL